VNSNKTEKSKDSLRLLVQQQTIDSIFLLKNIIDVNSINKAILFDLKYSSTDNFMHIKLYERINRPFLQKDVAERLSKCQDFLSSIDSNLHLIIYDALRPVSIQWKIWNALDTIPYNERVKYASNPINKSLHNFGAAVDLTICDSKRVPLNMGADFDEFRKIAYPSMENYYLSIGKLTIQQIENRKLLRKVLQSQAFRNLSTEWWHFNACSRADALIKYQVVENEP
jgi:D-alanyl-D-alanine dipeptidase